MPTEIRTRTVAYSVQVELAATGTTPASTRTETRFRVESYAVEVADPLDTSDDHLIPPDAKLLRAADYEDSNGNGALDASDRLLAEETYAAAPLGAAGTGHEINTPEQFVAALFANDLSNAYVNLDVSTADPSNPVYQAIYAEYQRQQPAATANTLHNLTFRSLQQKDLSGTTFAGDVSRANFIGANLSGAQFLGPVANTSFLYANLTGAQFNNTVRNGDFAFSQMTSNPFAVPPENSTLTGTPFARTDERLFAQLSISSSEQARLIDSIGRDRLAAWVAGAGSSPDVFTVLRDQGIDMNARLSTSWRSYLYDNLGAIREDSRVKPMIFDAIDGRYGDQPFAATMQSLYDYQVDGAYVFRDLINRGLAQGLLNDNGASLDDPYNGAATPLIMRFTNVGGGFANWLASDIEWNARRWPVSEIAIPREYIDQLLADPKISDGDRAEIRRRADDGIVTLADLTDIPDADQLLYSYLGGV